METLKRGLHRVVGDRYALTCGRQSELGLFTTTNRFLGLVPRLIDGSLIEIQAAVDETRDKAQEAVRRGEQAKFALAATSERVAIANDSVEAALERLHESDARMAAVAERLGSSAGRSAPD